MINTCDLFILLWFLSYFYNIFPHANENKNKKIDKNKYLIMKKKNKKVTIFCSLLLIEQ